MELTQIEKQFISKILRQVNLPAEQGHFAVEIAKKLELSNTNTEGKKEKSSNEG